MSPSRHLRDWIVPLLLLGAFLALLSACDADVESEVQTAIASAAETAIAEGLEAGGTKAAELKETAVAGVATQAAVMLTRLAEMGPSPWATSWIPDDHTAVVANMDAILNGTGLQGESTTIVEKAIVYEVNPAFALAMFRKEASFAAPNTSAYANKNPGNIQATGECDGKPAGTPCAGVYGEISTDGRFGVYASMATGLEAYFKLLDNEYQPGTARDCQSITCIIQAYCPPAECNTELYVDQIEQWTRQYQAQLLGAQP